MEKHVTKFKQNMDLLMATSKLLKLCARSMIACFICVIDLYVHKG